jgi:hypothetical protein
MFGQLGECLHQVLQDIAYNLQLRSGVSLYYVDGRGWRISGGLEEIRLYE